MNNFAVPRIFLLASAVSIGSLLPMAGWAQNMPGAPMGAGNIATGRNVRGAPEKAPVAEPDAVPGAKSRAPVAPATKSAVDMSPTDALFDAINRGDIAAARDALNRGADLSGVNILGMTPMELSVDLGRNDISFLLLSMRGEDSGRGSRAAGGGAQPNVTPVKAVAASGATKSGKRPPMVVAEKPIAAPKLFANDGGTPIPGSGFLGFDTRAN